MADNKTENRVPDIGRIHGATDTDLDKCNRTINTDFPTFAIPEIRQGSLMTIVVQITFNKTLMTFLLVKLSTGNRLDVVDGTEKTLFTKVLE